MFWTTKWKNEIFTQAWHPQKYFSSHTTGFITFLYKFIITFSTSKYNINPNSHGLRWWCHEIISPIISLYAESQFWRGTFYCAQVVNIDVFDGLEIDATTGLAFWLVREVEQWTFWSVINEPASIPRLYAAAHLDQESTTRAAIDGHMLAAIQIVTGTLYECTKIKLSTLGQVPRQWPRL